MIGNMVLWASQQPLGADFLKSDHVIASKAETMVETIAHLDDVYGGAREYSRTIGLTDEEVRAATDAGWTAVDLGPRILRVETAATLLAGWASIVASS